jgi:hypothetical protein
VPALDDGELDVWLTEWQIDEDGYDVAVGDEITWSVSVMDQPWIDHILKAPRTVPLQLDFSAEDSAKRNERREKTYAAPSSELTRPRCASSLIQTSGGSRCPKPMVGSSTACRHCPTADRTTAASMVGSFEFVAD